ncbi:MAG: hypothetical protein QGD90_05930 [Candidatus Hydrogenedentes bacterium]|nr:hypothetical protein [Candidatus Hydrogenedentota bacterium]
MKDPVAKYLRNRAERRGRPVTVGEVEGLAQVVVIPILAESAELEATLASLAANTLRDLQRTLIVCVVNNRSPGLVDEDVLADNRATLEFLKGLIQRPDGHSLSNLRLVCMDASSPGCELGDKEGVGTARKLGLDWALAVLRRAGNTEGVMVCLDADTRVESNYLAVIGKHFGGGPGWGAVIDFAHRFDGPETQQAAIVAYELFLRYHVLGLRYARSPYAFHTIGSTIACTMEAYAAAGGMKRRQAGEDFYFLQDLAKTGQVARIAETTVHPSSRASWRVPFGTGKRVERFMQGNHEEYRVYHPDSYDILRAWLETVRSHPEADAEYLFSEARGIAAELGNFLRKQKFETIWPKLQANTRDSEMLLRQFDRWFDGFTTLKLVHHLRDSGLAEQNTFDALAALMWRHGGHTIEKGQLRADLEAQKSVLALVRKLD